MFIRKLAFSNFAVRKSRVALTVAAVALSVSLVVAVTSGYASLFETAFKYLNLYMGTTDARIGRTNDPVGVPWRVVEEIRKDPTVRSADGRLSISTYLPNPELPGTTKHAGVTGIDRPSDRRVDRLALEAGRWFDTSDSKEIVIDQGVASMLKIGVGQTLSLPYANRRVDFTVVGIAHKPAVIAEHMKVIYAPLHTLQKLAGAEGRVSSILVDLKGTDPKTFQQAWMANLDKPVYSSTLARAMPLQFITPAPSGPTTRPAIQHSTTAGISPSTSSATQPTAVTTQVDLGPGVPGDGESLIAMMIDFTSGAGAGQSATITQYSAATHVATLDPPLNIPVDSTTAYTIKYPPLTIHLTSEIRSKMEDNLQGIKLLTYLGSTVSMLAATFIIFSALSMGVSERQRSLAMLRAVGAFKEQIGILVVFEGLILASLGLLIGVPLGWLWIKILTLLFSDVFAAGAVISWSGILYAVGGTLVTALAASLLPAWNATRVSPLEAMTPLSHPTGHGAPIGWFAIGLLLIAIDPFLFFGPMESLARVMHASNPEQSARYYKFHLHFIAGLPGMFAGFFLVAPMCVWIVERVLGPIVAMIFGLRFTLLRQQLSTGIWRAAGTCAALMVGLAVLIVMQVTGHTVLGGWKLPDKFPDVFIGTSAGLSPEEAAALAKTPGIHEMMPVEIATTSLGSFGGSPYAIAGSLLIPNSTMFIGVDPNKVFHMMQLDFILGTPQEAQQRLNEGGWVVVTEEYRQLTHCKIGDPIVLGNRTFRIAAVVWSPGIDVMKGMYDMTDQFDQRTMSSVFGSIKDGEIFGARPYMFAADLNPGIEREQLIKQIKKELNSEGLQVGDVREIKAKIETGFFRLLNMLSTVAFAAMAVASLGVTNTIIAGVRSRRWQFGILRSIGVTRGQLLRLVMAEAFLLGLIGCVLGLWAGFLMSADANSLTRVITGYNPPLVIPWKFIGVGVASVLFIAIAASLWPAVNVAKTEPLALLQAGRSAT